MSDDAWRQPAAQEVESVLASIADLSLRSLFFSELKNPEWLEPLAELRVFRNPPEPQRDSDGVERVLPWPEGDYLICIAESRPEKVTELLTSVASSRNPWVQRTIISAAKVLPSEYARKLAQPIAGIVKSSDGWLNVHDVLAVTQALSVAGEPKLVKTLLKALFEPHPGEPETTAFGVQTEVKANIEDYFYQELLPQAVPILASLEDIDGLRLVTGWLRRASKIRSGSNAERLDYDASALWRPSVAPHSQNFGLHELPDALIDAVRDTALELGRSGRTAAVTEYLNEVPSYLVRRIALEVAAQFLNAEGPSGELLSVATRMLLDPALMDIGARPEYVHLATSLIPHLGDDSRDAWVELVRAGAWQGTDDEIRGRIAAWDERDVADVLEDEIVERRQHTLHRLLQPLAGALPAPLADDLASFEARWGSVEHPEFSSYTTSFTGPTSPKTRAELAELSPGELGAYLKSWVPDNGYHFGPSIEGLARELESVAETSPDLVAGIADDLAGFGRAYARAALTGWAKAVRSGYVPSDDVWRLVQDIVSQGDDGSDDAAERAEDADDPVWRWAQRSAVDLIAAVTDTSQRPLTDETLAHLWGLLAPLTNHPDPTSEHEARYGGSNMDPLTLSLNTTRPAALRAAIRLASANHHDKPGNPSAIEMSILEAISNHLESDPSLAVAAVIGEGLGRIWSVDQAWVEPRQHLVYAVLDKDEGRRARSDVLVSVALRSYNTGKVFFDLIRPAISQVFTRRYNELSHTEGWREHRSTVNAAALHTITAYLIGIIDRDDPEIQKLFSDEVPVEVVAEVLGHVGWQIMRTPKEDPAPAIPQNYLVRARELIDWRVAEIRASRASVGELTQFYWWAQAGYFQPSWWLPILKFVAAEGELDSRGALGKPLADAAGTEPLLAIQVFGQIYGGGTDRQWRDFDLVQHAPRLLASALHSNDGLAIEGAEHIKDTLGRDGHFQALQELDQLLAG